MQQLSDEELITQSRGSGLAAASDPYLNELFSRHQRRVSLWCLRYAGNREDAADLAQEILARVWRNLDSYQGNSKFTTWLYMVCRNHCLNHVKAKSHEPDVMKEIVDIADTRGANTEEGLAREEHVRLARRWINDALDETERKVVRLHFGDGMAVDAITRLLGLKNPSGAKAHLVSARRKLQESARRWKARYESARKQ